LIESTIISWIGSSTTAGSRVSVGSRLQSTNLPALVVEIPSGQSACIAGPASGNCDVYQVTIRAVAETMSAAQSLAAAAVSRMKTQSVADGSLAYENSFASLDEPVVGEGDEMEPAICTSSMTVLYKH
jgi:hypothetical protein